MYINIGDEITICGTVIGRSIVGIDGIDGDEVEGVLIRTKSGYVVSGVPVDDIKTIHPYKEPTKEDMRKGN